MEKTSLYNIGGNFRSYLPFIRERLPAIYREKYPLLVAFIDAYYEWLEQEKNATDRLLSYELFKDSDYGADEFIENFRKELMPFFPATTLVDNTLLIKQINEFYRSKGKPKALEFLFRVLFDESPVIEYPLDRIIFQTGNQNNTDVIMRINYIDPPATSSVPLVNFIGRTIKGQTSGATAIVADASERVLDDVTFVELSLETISITPFIVNEIISTVVTPTSTLTLTGRTHGLISSNNVTSGGTDYELHDSVVFSSEGDGVGVIATVSKVTGGVSRIQVVDGGAGYNDFDVLTVTITNAEGTSGSGATANALISGGRVSSVVVTDPGSGYEEGVTVTISGGTPTRPAQAVGFTKGTLVELFFDDPGVSYENVPPTINFSGFPRGGSGATATLTIGVLATINSHVVRYRGGTDFPEQNFNVLLVMGGGTGAFAGAESVYQGASLGTATWTGVVVSWDADDRRLIVERNLMTGFDPDLPIKGNTSAAQWTYDSPYSHPIRIDAGDNEVNREYTYNIKTSIPVASYGKYVKDNTHPAGMRFFGIFEIVGEAVNLSTILSAVMFSHHPDGINTLNADGRPLFLNKEIGFGWRHPYSMEFFNPVHGTIDDINDETFEGLEDSGRIKNLRPRIFTTDVVVGVITVFESGVYESGVYE